MDKIKIVVVEDDQGWLKAMVSFINNEEDMMVVATATNKKDAIGLAATLEVDIFLMDINLSENKTDGIYAAAEILQISKAKVIMLTSIEEETILADSFAAGAVNYVLKEQYEEIPSIIRVAHRNRFNPIEVLGKKYFHLKKDEQLNQLTTSEMEVFELLEKGYTHQQIQKMLVKSQNTVNSQIRGILQKLGVRNSKEAIRKVRSGGILYPTDRTGGTEQENK